MSAAIMQTVCPAWCEGRDPGVGPCDSQHHAGWAYTPATGHPSAAEGPAPHGFEFPAVGVALVQSDLDGDDGPRVSLHILGPNDDAQVYLRPSEARRVVALIQSALEQIEAGTER